MQKDVESLDSRIAKLDDSAHSLESGLDKRLGEMSGNVLRDTRGHLESMANEALGQFAAHSAQTLDDQFSEVNAKMATAGQSIIASAGESLNSQVRSASRAFEHSMEEMASLSIERWRLKLAAGLNSLAKGLNEQFPLSTEPGNGANGSQS